MTMTISQIVAARLEIERCLRNREDALAISLLDRLQLAERERMARRVLEPELYLGCACEDRA